MNSCTFRDSAGNRWEIRKSGSRFDVSGYRGRTMFFCNCSVAQIRIANRVTPKSTHVFIDSNLIDATLCATDALTEFLTTQATTETTQEGASNEH